MNETPKKIPYGGECFILCGKKILVAKEKINIFGKSALGISLTFRATKVDLSSYVDSEKLVVCCTKCYNRLVRYKNAVRKVDEIREEIQREFDVTFCIKRLAKDQNNAPEAKKCLSFGDARSSVSQSTPATQAGRAQVPSKIAPSAVVSSGICVSPIAF